MDKKNKSEIDKLFKETKTKKEIIKESRLFVVDYLSFRKNIDTQKTIELVKNEISFKGDKAWILIFSIIITSIGLNVGSIAIVIGAMLIMPLMGPVVGVGLFTAINDLDMLKKSLVNLGMVVSLSIFTAFLYFLISPLTKLTPELEINTYPTILNVLVAIFGGFALFIANTNKSIFANTVYGVAIATALMPPLCTAGYGLAVWNLSYFVGALYLFAINSIFIALSAFIFAKFLKFPFIKYANSTRRKRISQIATTIAIVVMIPSALLFWKLLRQEIFTSNIDTFVTSTMFYEDAYVVNYKADFDTQSLNVYMLGEQVPDEVINSWRQILKSNNKLSEVGLQVIQGKDDDSGFSSSNFVTLSDMYSKNLEMLQSKDVQIRNLQSQINKFSTGNIPFYELSKEIQINYKNLESVSYSTTLVSDFNAVDTVPQFNLKWTKGVSTELKQANNAKIKEWLEFKLERDSIIVNGE